MIEIKNLKKSYVKNRVIIPDLSLTFQGHGLNIIVGKSGCGKTTLLNILGAMDLDYEGNVIVDGQDLHDKSYGEITDYRNFISAFVFQKNSLFEYLTVEENMKLCLNIQNNESNISEALEKVGLKGFEHKKVKSLSGGEKQRVAIARALIKNCEIVFADEPTSALDSKNSHKIFQLFKEISKTKLVIVVTHDVKKAELYADRMIRVEDKIFNEKKEEKSNEVIDTKKYKSKPFALLPIFLHQLKRGLLINIFITILMILGLTVTNIALEQKKIKDEYDNYGVDNNFPIKRAIKTQINNDINKFYVVPSGDALTSYDYIEYTTSKKSGLNENDMFFLDAYLKDYTTYKSKKGILETNLIIDNLSTRQKMQGQTDSRDKYPWEQEETSNYSYYLYDENNDYDLSYGKEPTDKNEIMITDIIAEEYAQKNNMTIDELIGETLNLKFIYDSIDSSLVSKKFTYLSGRDGTYYLYNTCSYVVSGIIETGLLNYYAYNTDSNLFILLPEFKTQDRDDEFMNSAKFQPFGYVVINDDLEDKFVSNQYYGNIQLDMIYTNDINIKPTIAPFTGQYNFTGWITERGEKLAGVDDNLNIDYYNRIIAKSITSNNLEDNEIMITQYLAKLLFPNLSFTNSNTVQESFESIANKEVELSFVWHNETYHDTFKIVGITKDNDLNDIFVSFDTYYNIIQFGKNKDQELIVDLKDINLKNRMTLMEQLFKVGYSLVPVDVMPGAYLEFVEGKGETVAEVDFNGLASLYYDYEIQTIDDVGYFVHDDVVFGTVDNIVEPTIAFIITSPLFSVYYTTDSSNTGNYILEIASSMYLFLLVVAILISIGFVYLKERRERDTVVRLSMLGVRPKHMYFLHFLTYFVLTIILGGVSILLTLGAVALINQLFTYSFFNGELNAVIHRVRLMFTSSSVLISIVAALSMFIIYMICSIIVTIRYRK